MKMLRRRKWDILLPALGIFFVFAVILLFLPASYRSTSTLQIEGQKIPPEHEAAKSAEYAEKHLLRINQRIMRHERLLEIVTRFHLYADLRRKSGTAEAVERMRRKDIQFRILGTDMIAGNMDKPGTVTTTFAVSYEGKNPGRVQQVTNALASLYLAENRMIQQAPDGRLKSLEDEKFRVKKDLTALDAEIAALRSKNWYSYSKLPDLHNVDPLNHRLHQLKAKEKDLLKKLAAAPSAEGQDRQKLSELVRNYVKLRLNASEEHPEMIKVKQEMAALQQQLESSPSQGASAGKNAGPDSAALSSQLARTRADIKSVRNQLRAEANRNGGVKRGIESGPRMEERYKHLLNERDRMQARYNDLVKKHDEAGSEQPEEKIPQEERFSLIDPAQLPGKPVRPNLPLMLVLGLVLGLGAGVGTASLREHADSSISSVDDLELITRQNVFLAAIPEIDTRKDRLENLKPDSAILAMERVILADAGETIDWVPPNYNQSRSVTLDPEVMKRNRCVAMFSNLDKVEPYRALRRLILNRTQEVGGNLIMVTSALPGEGKTLTAINLAFTLAREFMHTVLLVDCDLKKQSIHHVMGFKSDKGLLDYLLGECPARDLFVWPVVEKLSLISGGKVIDESSKMIGSPLMKELVEDIKNRYPERYIIFDVPPILTDVDALNLVPLVDYVLMVVEAGKTSLAEVNKAVQFLPKDKLLGFVLNRCRP